ncbi:Nutrient germinant receptor inner membrane subunit A (GerKA/GerAA/GerBA) [Candidatus Syntrophocurvum alkaliphilum]|uniref:Nutrient germinant receptor inner membrane subunit A (GerKA/GerAA/GerBA) n=1 Tax=Candidatus Syntrophocurvum alkaliphilum TaxID=2293317 RepID=A0A6I6DDP6_9FIRM|nr:spore germination protein [Candidatus Syntrophocurvum alkaliphilum]QGT98728.1 Nutrient germinant receptor inner membrane subunit A (GerKA/GerAA/GerBA) [Candidatus Syntrophocurvum alkaliphilum]
MRKLGKKNAKNQQDNNTDIMLSNEEIKLPLPLNEKLELLKPYLETNHDIIYRELYIKAFNIKAVIIYIEGIANDQYLHDNIIKPLILNNSYQTPLDKTIIDQISHTTIAVGNIQKSNNLQTIINHIFDGMTVLLCDGLDEALVFDIHGGEFRGIEEPTTEKSLRGNKEGFSEILDISLPLIRRRLKDPNLVVEKTIVGQRSRTQVAILYIKDIADPKIVTEVKKRINNIDIDNVFEGSYIEQMIEDNSYSLFAQIRTTERPDKAAALLAEGRIVVLTDGSPTALSMPSLFIEYFQASEDYYERTLGGSFTRLTRIFAFFIAISFPAIYVALTAYHPALIPDGLIVPLIQARVQVPFPVLLELLIFELIIQLIIEAGLRMPTTVGQTVGVVAGIILGQAAIAANLASPAVIMVVAITAIATFALPTGSLILASRIIRLPFLILSSFFGILGYSLAMFLMIAHLMSLNSFGVPYLSPIAPTRYRDLKQDTYIRNFIWSIKKRPVTIPHQDINDIRNKGRDK